MKNRFIASMLLAAVGDAMGYRRGIWQFNTNGVHIHQDLLKLTNNKGIKGLQIAPKSFPYSDDTIMHIATAEALLQTQQHYPLDTVCSIIARHYKECMKYMEGRAPGITCINSANILKEDGSNWKDIRFQKNGGGCGASMRAACIGLYYYDDMEKLIEISIESGRITHHNPIGYLGSFVAALFTSYAVRNIEPHRWLSLLLQGQLQKAKKYVAQNRQAQENIEGGDWQRFEQCWVKYAQRRKMKLDEPSCPVFPEPYGVKQRQSEYHELSINNWPGALGVDSVIIAYDALLSSIDYCDKKKKLQEQYNLWDQVCLRGVLHGGDNDSTGTIACAWYGALYGYESVHKENYLYSQRRFYIQELGEKIYDRVHGQKKEVK